MRSQVAPITDSIKTASPRKLGSEVPLVTSIWGNRPHERSTWSTCDIGEDWQYEVPIVLRPGALRPHASPTSTSIPIIRPRHKALEALQSLKHMEGTPMVLGISGCPGTKAQKRARNLLAHF
eukprot:2697645-Amphidinium_carterae.1